MPGQSLALQKQVVKGDVIEVAKLIIESQPAPKSLWKKRKVTPPFVVRAISAPGIIIKSRSTVKAYLVTDSPEKIELIGGEETFSDDGSTVFSKMQFSKGSHQHLVQCYFETQVATSDGRVGTLTTPSSEPFIICTNINQWIQSEKKIFKKICFGEGSQVGWSEFRKALENHFSRAIATSRGLSASDLTFVYHKNSR